MSEGKVTARLYFVENLPSIQQRSGYFLIRGDIDNGTKRNVYKLEY